MFRRFKLYFLEVVRMVIATIGASVVADRILGKDFQLDDFKNAIILGVIISGFVLYDLIRKRGE